MPSDNPVSADNQQGRLSSQWIVGFADGEGCFSVSIFKNRTSKFGYQVFPEFVITQGAKSQAVLKDIQSFFGCGNIYENKRKDNHRESLYRYCVRSRKDLLETIIPFFEANHLRTAKRSDFKTFSMVVRMVENQQHMANSGLNRIRRLAGSMNRQKRRTREPSETTRSIRNINHVA